MNLTALYCITPGHVWAADGGPDSMQHWRSRHVWPPVGVQGARPDVDHGWDGKTSCRDDERQGNCCAVA